MRILEGDERDKNIVVSLGSPTFINCYALGYPYPSVTWWKNGSLIPLKTSEYEVRKDYSLLIHSVRLSNLGLYTCQAYNGYGKAASWSVTIQALGPVHTSNPEDQQYLNYVIPSPQNPNQQPAPLSPAPAYRQTPTPRTTLNQPVDSPRETARPPNNAPERKGNNKRMFN